MNWIYRRIWKLFDKRKLVFYFNFSCSTGLFLSFLCYRRILEKMNNWSFVLDTEGFCILCHLKGPRSKNCERRTRWTDFGFKSEISWIFCSKNSWKYRRWCSIKRFNRPCLKRWMQFSVSRTVRAFFVPFHFRKSVCIITKSNWF